MHRIFLSGPMTGIENYNYPAFNEAATKLRALGYTVLNPAENPEQDSWEDYMRLALIQLLQADIVAQLPGWQDSRGARMEHDVANELAIPCMSAENLLCQNPVAIHVVKPNGRIDLGAPLEFCGVDIDACHKKNDPTDEEMRAGGFVPIEELEKVQTGEQDEEILKAVVGGKEWVTSLKRVA